MNGSDDDPDVLLRAELQRQREVCHREQEARRRLEARCAELLDNANDGIISITSAGTIAVFNRGAERIWGYPAADVLGQPLSILLPAQDGDRHRKLVQGFATDGSRSREMAPRRRVFGLRADGTIFPAEITISKTMMDGELLMTAFVRDLSARHRLEAQLRQAQHFEALGRLTGGIAHDFNNILTGMAGYAKLVLATLPEKDPRHQDVREIVQAGERGASLTRRLLAYGRDPVSSPQTVDANAVVLGCRRLLEHILGDKRTLRLDLQPGLAPINADAVQIERVLLNLVSNARDATAAGGEVIIRTGQHDTDAGRSIHLAVRDDGVGMDASTRACLFEPFFTTKDSDRGSGLGLSIVQEIVQQHGGVIEVCSAPGRGAEFVIRIPAVAPPKGARADAGAPSVAGQTVLLVDDDPTVHKLARRLLTEAHYQVLAASDAEAALALTAKHGAAIDVLVVALDPLGRTAHRLVRPLRGHLPHLRVLYLTDQQGASIARTLEESPRVLLKPIEFDALADAVRALLDSTRDQGDE